jgi:hypothetical protein
MDDNSGLPPWASDSSQDIKADEAKDQVGESTSLAAETPSLVPPVSPATSPVPPPLPASPVNPPADSPVSPSPIVSDQTSPPLPKEEELKEEVEKIISELSKEQESASLPPVNSAEKLPVSSLPTQEPPVTPAAPAVEEKPAPPEEPAIPSTPPPSTSQGQNPPIGVKPPKAPLGKALLVVAALLVVVVSGVLAYTLVGGNIGQFGLQKKATNYCPGPGHQECSNLNKCNVQGGCDPACCDSDSDCPSGQKCDIPNGNCDKGKSCNPQGSGYHKECVGNQCVEVPGEGEDRCTDHNQCSSSPTYDKCSDWNYVDDSTCTADPNCKGPGQNGQCCKTSDGKNFYCCYRDGNCYSGGTTGQCQDLGNGSIKLKGPMNNVRVFKMVGTGVNCPFSNSQQIEVERVTLVQGAEKTLSLGSGECGQIDAVGFCGSCKPGCGGVAPTPYCEQSCGVCGWKDSNGTCHNGTAMPDGTWCCRHECVNASGVRVPEGGSGNCREVFGTGTHDPRCVPYTWDAPCGAASQTSNCTGVEVIRNGAVVSGSPVNLNRGDSITVRVSYSGAVDNVGVKIFKDGTVTVPESLVFNRARGSASTAAGSWTSPVYTVALSGTYSVKGFIKVGSTWK